MKLIFQISKYIVIPLLLDWLDLAGFSSLLVATGSLEYHDKLRALFEGYRGRFHCAFLSSAYVPLSIPALKWFERMGLDFPDKIIMDYKVAAKYSSVVGILKSILFGSYSSHQRKSALVTKCLEKVRTMCFVSNSTDFVPNQYNNLQHIELSLFDFQLSTVLPLCGPSITVLDFRGVYNGSALYDVIMRCPNLSVLKLIPSVFRKDATTMLCALTVHCRKLSVLDVYDHFFHALGYSFSHRELQILLLHHYFCRLDHAYCYGMSIRTMFGYRSDISTLEIRMKPTVDLVGLVAAGNHLLTCLRIENCSSDFEGLEVILAACPHLRKFHLSHADVNFVPPLDVVSSHLEDLELRNLGPSPLVFNCPFPMLRRLCLMGCCLTNEELQQCLTFCPALTALNVENNDGIDDAIGEMLKPFHSLTALNLSRCRSITNDCMVLLAQYCVNLRELHIQRCRHVSDEGLSHVLMNGKMKCLDLFGCSKAISLQTVLCIAKYCKGIERLVVEPYWIDRTKAAKLLKGCERLGFEEHIGSLVSIIRPFQETCTSEMFLET